MKKTKSSHNARAKPSGSECAEPRNPISQAQMAVFSIPELLEIIFSHCHVRHLLISCQRVCVCWRDSIAQSPKLQKRLYLLPDWDKPRAKRKINPLLLAAFGGNLFFNHFDEAPRWEWGRNRRCFDTRDFTNLDLPFADMKNGRKRHLAFTRAGASWRRMLVSQPPPIHVEHVTSITTTREKHVSNVELSDGLRMGMLYDFVFDILFGGDHWLEGEKQTVFVGWMQHNSPNNSVLHTYWPVYNDIDPGKQPNCDIVIAALRKTDYCVYEHGWRNEWWVDRENYLRNRRRTSSAWMFKCEEYTRNAVAQALAGGDAAKLLQ